MNRLAGPVPQKYADATGVGRLRFITRILDVRQRRRLSQKQVAEFAGVSAMTISKIEQGSLWPSDDLLDRIAAALGVPVAYFHHGDPGLAKALTIAAAPGRFLSAGEHEALLAREAQDRAETLRSRKAQARRKYEAFRNGQKRQAVTAEEISQHYAQAKFHLRPIVKPAEAEVLG